ncbi:MAG: hypothetical protein KF681_02985 [Bdellovibrionaceae bacterium]|nr:hypothetical protein [Pseudobdellovibrionaceae bacterium]
MKKARNTTKRKAALSQTGAKKKASKKKSAFREPADYFATFIQNMSTKFKESKHWPRALRRFTQEAGGSVSHPQSDNTRFQAPRGPQ